MSVGVMTTVSQNRIKNIFLLVQTKLSKLPQNFNTKLCPINYGGKKLEPSYKFKQKNCVRFVIFLASFIDSKNSSF